MGDKHWTASEVEARLAEAADTLRRLPERRIGGYHKSWPDFPLDPRDAYGWTETRMRRIPPSPTAIDRMEQTIHWLKWLEPDDAKLIWDRASGVIWKQICWRFGLGRTAAWERWVIALHLISLKLNDQRVPCSPAKLRLEARSARLR